MSLRFNTVQEEDEWEIVTADWWRTAFILVPWTYHSRGKSPRQQFHGSLFAGLSSQCPHQNIPSDGVQCKISSEDDTHLNSELVGISGAMAVVALYEEDVGFSYSTCPSIEPHELNLFAHVDLSIDINEDDLLTGRQSWKELVDDLMNGEIFENTNTDIGGSLESSLIGSFSSAGDPTASSTDLSSSDGSIDSFVMPSTPKAKHVFPVQVKSSSPNGSIDDSGFEHLHLLSSGKSLNAAASSFVPTLCSQSNEDSVHFPPLVDNASKSFSPILSFSNFTFPTLNAPSQPQGPVILKKDEQGFFTEVQNEPSNGDEPVKLLPPFLQESPQRNRSRKSRTREIVDRLRSETSSDDTTTTTHFPFSNGIELSPRYASHCPSPIHDDRSFMIPRLSVSEDGGDRASGLSTPSLEDDDGWISQPNTSSPHRKAKRTRELFLALTRRRTDSLSSENLKTFAASPDDSSAPHPCNISAPPSPSPRTPPPLTSNDGWIENNPTPLESQNNSTSTSSRESDRRRKKSSTHNTSSRAPLPASSISSHSVSSTSAGFPSPHHPTIPIPPHMAPQAIPYFFSAYPAVATPVPYTAFMHFPAFPISMPIHSLAVSSPYGTSPALVATRRSGSVKPAMPTYRAKQSPLW